MNHYKRCFPLDGAFMNYGIKDIIYGYLQLMATFNPSTRELYIKYSNYVSEKNLISEVASCSTRTVERAISSFENSGLIKVVDGNIILTPSTNRYQLVEHAILKMIVDTGEHNIVRIYSYLLNKYLWKKSQSTEYLFTITELANAIGYNSFNSNIGNRIEHVLNTLKELRIIKYEYEYIHMRVGKKIIPVRKIKLINVCSSISDIKYSTDNNKSTCGFRF